MSVLTYSAVILTRSPAVSVSNTGSFAISFHILTVEVPLLSYTAILRSRSGVPSFFVIGRVEEMLRTRAFRVTSFAPAWRSFMNISSPVGL